MPDEGLFGCSGASGAGKTTFMDVIAGRKNQGRITGDIQINGHPQVRSCR
jgi:ABC-type multidrug transport system ATPase subunit